MELLVPTYYGHAYADEIETEDRPDFGPPYAEVLVYSEDGVRIVLGSCDPKDTEMPDIKIERRPRGWAIFLHPEGGGDPSGYVYFLDDGRSFLVKEFEYGPTPAIEVLDAGMDVPDIDEVDAPATTPDDVCHTVETTDDNEGPEPTAVLGDRAKERVTANDIDDCLLIEEAYEFASELRSLAFWEESTQRWRLDMELGMEFIEGVKRLLKDYKLAPFQQSDGTDYAL